MRNDSLLIRACRSTSVLLVSVILAGLLSSCQSPPKLYQMEYSGYLDTVSQFTMPAESEAAFMDQAEFFEERLSYYHQQYTSFEQYSGVTNVWTLNQEAGQAPVEVSQDIMDLLVFSQGLAEETDGAISITLGTLTKLWREAQNKYAYGVSDAAVPSEAELTDAMKHVDEKDLVLNPDRLTVYFTDAELKLDVGAIAKGFVAERIATELEGRGVSSALLNLGGNVRTVGEKELDATTPWVIGIQNPARRLQDAVTAYPGWQDETQNYPTSESTDESAEPSEGASTEVILPNLTYPIGPETETTETIPIAPIETEEEATPGEPAGEDQDQLTADQADLTVLNSVNSSLVTSGIYERFFIADGNLYHHIIDPQTGMPSQRFQSVSVVTAHSGRADAFATALFNMSLEEGLALVSGYESLEVIWVDMEGKITETPGFAKMVRSNVEDANPTPE